ncbi:MFS transporter [Acinetobacter boissieri]|uniref:MFS transporter, MHS family, proline/betaine transporter n=1 Tax=Acinetobacter boissieri TaxID=1219383 RepID=A0A1G6HLJ2_9GAMM|nr:MFS transporter [Acinetobacter boissieri]SDB95119.1 MFS transporter, MHS family, proline/betaine transporter [Acinetobacter boissieri]
MSEVETRRKAVLATVIGNGMEWFDFTIYSFMAVTIGKLFFPSGNDVTSYLLALATFGVGFFMRPVGGIILGSYGDRFGRKSALSLTVILMALGTFLIAIAPTYEQIGIFAPFIIVIARLLQGFSAGGEMGTATAFLTEHAPENKKAYYSSWIQVSVGIAILLGSLVGMCLTLFLTQSQLESWGWRIPFIIGTLIGPIGVYIRTKVEEPETFTKTKPLKSPIREVFINYKKEVTIGFMLVVLWTVFTYAILFYVPSYSSRILGLSKTDGFICGMVGGFALICFTPIVGYYADKVGRRPFLLSSAILTLLLTYPLFNFINLYPSLTSVIVFQLVMGALISGYIGAILAVFNELLPTEVLSSGVSIAYNFAVTIFGGFATFIITWLVATTGDNIAPAYYIMAAALISSVGAYLYRESKTDNNTVKSKPYA